LLIKARSDWFLHGYKAFPAAHIFLNHTMNDISQKMSRKKYALMPLFCYFIFSGNEFPDPNDARGRKFP